MKQKNKKVDFFGMLLGTLAASLLQNMLTGKEIIRAGEKVIATSWDALLTYLDEIQLEQVKE